MGMTQVHTRPYSQGGMPHPMYMLLCLSLLQDDVPNIAILGAGGGLRAMIALLATLEELQKQGLLDTIMYLCGVSGSTWCMSSLYKRGDWAEKLQTLEEHIRDTLANSTWSLTKATKMLVEAAKDENYSLTEFWAYTAIYGMLHELDKGHLSDQKDASENGNNPYPIYAAVDERSFSKVTEYSPGKKANKSPGHLSVKQTVSYFIYLQSLEAEEILRSSLELVQN
uniref:PLA2c domain-containing protein n=1 Tax=Pelusios castaneus TaxID=367368 RepID=A0A8C8S6Y8_9SAUR